MYDLHTHSLLSDGCLLPSEVARRYEAKGYKAIAITDHADAANIKRVVSEILDFTKSWPKSRIKVLPGIELTHISPEQFKPLVKYARSKGIKVIIGHGETTVEPVVKGTNLAALQAGVTILAHPGRISDAEVKLAKQKGIFLEITARRGHRNTNRYVAKKALKIGARLSLDSDSHSPDDILAPEKLRMVGIKAGLSAPYIGKMYKDMELFLEKPACRQAGRKR